jgi:uncharacterized glyoxalase superfamily protein PhnB
MTSRKVGAVLVVDGANVVGARPDGWWNDRAGAARRLHEQLMTAEIDDDIVLVLEGAAKAGVPAGRDGHVTVVHALQDGDAEIVRQAHRAAESGAQVRVVTADRLLAARVAKAGPAVGPTWLLDRLT